MPCKIQFSPDSRRSAYIARRGKQSYMVVDQQERRDWPGSGSAVFSPDSKSVADGTRQGGKWVVLLDNKPVGGRYEMIVGDGPSFHEDGSLEFLGTRQGVLYRVIGKRMSHDAEPRKPRP